VTEGFGLVVELEKRIGSAKPVVSQCQVSLLFQDIAQKNSDLLTTYKMPLGFKFYSLASNKD
jgi:hypothetical protein